MLSQIAEKPISDLATKKKGLIDLGPSQSAVLSKQTRNNAEQRDKGLRSSGLFQAEEL